MPVFYALVCMWLGAMMLRVLPCRCMVQERAAIMAFVLDPALSVLTRVCPGSGFWVVAV